MKLGAFDDILVPLDIERLLNRIYAARGQKKKKEGPMATIWHSNAC